jgi:hypothetical protein
MIYSRGHRALSGLFGWDSSNEKHNADTLPKPCRIGPVKIPSETRSRLPSSRRSLSSLETYTSFISGPYCRRRPCALSHIQRRFSSVKRGVLTLFLVLAATLNERPISCTCTSARSRLGWPYPVFRQIKRRNLDNKPVFHRMYEWLRRNSGAISRRGGITVKLRSVNNPCFYLPMIFSCRTLL